MSKADEDDPFSDDDEDFLELTRRPPKSAEVLLQTQTHIRQQLQQTQFRQTQHQGLTIQQQIQVQSQINSRTPLNSAVVLPLPLSHAPVPLEPHKTQITPLSTQNDIAFQASGQVALLKAKNEQLEREKLQASIKLRKEFDLKSIEQNILIKKLQDTVRKLEDEQKFQAAEIRDYRMKNKRRRVDEEKEKEVETVDFSKKTPPLSKSVPSAPQAQQPYQRQQQFQKVTQPIMKPPPLAPKSNQPTPRFQTRFAVPKSIEDNTIFIDHISSCCIPGLDVPVMTLLDKISISSEEFRFDNFTCAPTESLKSSLTNHLSRYKKILKLDELISTLIRIIIEIVKFLLRDVQVIKDFTEQRTDLKHNRHQLLAIPYLLAIIHFSLTYRPKAITNISLVFTLIKFSLMLVEKFDYLLRPAEVTNEFYARSVKLKLKSIHYEFLESLIMIYALDLIEILVVNSTQSNGKTKLMVKDFLVEMQKRLLTLFRLIFACPKHSSVNLMLSVINLLNASLNLWESDQNSGFPLVSFDLLKTFVIMATEDFEHRKDWLVYGLNRSIGNNLDADLIKDIVPQKINLPYQLNPIYSKNHKEQHVSHNHRLHHAALSVQILQFVEKLVLFDYQNEHSDTLKFLVKEPTIFKSLIMCMSKIQQFNFLNPRKPDHLNSKLTEVLSYCLSLIHLIKELYRLTPSESIETSEFNFSSDLSFELFIILSRIAFPSRRDTCEPSVNFLLEYQQQAPQLSRYFSTKLPNVVGLPMLNLTNSKVVKPIVNAVSNTPNGLEFAYDLETFELARSFLNELATPDEADMFYTTMRMSDVSMEESHFLRI